MKFEKIKEIQNRAAEYLKKANIVLTDVEKENLEVADFGLNDIETMGLQLVIYENNDRYCAKELVLFPHQTCPEHRHPPINNNNIGKQETFRCRWGEVYLYIEGAPTLNPKAKILEGYKDYLTVWNEKVLKPGEQFTIPPNTLHWFQAGDNGAIVSEFSSKSIDESDLWTDPNIKRIPIID